MSFHLQRILMRIIPYFEIIFFYLCLVLRMKKVNMLMKQLARLIIMYYYYYYHMKYRQVIFYDIYKSYLLSLYLNFFLIVNVVILLSLQIVKKQLKRFQIHSFLRHNQNELKIYRGSLLMNMRILVLHFIMLQLQLIVFQQILSYLFSQIDF